MITCALRLSYCERSTVRGMQEILKKKNMSDKNMQEIVKEEVKKIVESPFRSPTRGTKTNHYYQFSNYRSNKTCAQQYNC